MERVGYFFYQLSIPDENINDRRQMIIDRFKLSGYMVRNYVLCTARERADFEITKRQTRNRLGFESLPIGPNVPKFG